MTIQEMQAKIDEYKWMIWDYSSQEVVMNGYVPFEESSAQIIEWEQEIDRLKEAIVIKERAIRDAQDNYDYELWIHFFGGDDNWL